MWSVPGVAIYIILTKFFHGIKVLHCWYCTEDSITRKKRQLYKVRSDIILLQSKSYVHCAGPDYHLWIANCCIILFFRKDTCNCFPSLFLQISGSRKPHSLVFRLKVTKPRVKIIGHNHSSSGEFHLLKGSTISLRCVIDEVTAPPQ